ncbi:MAG: TIR domain-containing protein [Chloroflexi bacterium]|nr:TIR domain-containing protein [Chloroflexota bacterium]
MSNDTRNVFISHIHEDDEGLGKLKSLLGDNGMTIRDYSISSDNPNRAHSDDYIKSSILAPRIRQSSTLVVYISPETKGSQWVDWEIEYAQKNDKRIVGVWAYGESGCAVPEALDKYADAVVGWHGNSIIEAINGETNDWQRPDGAITEPRDIKRYSCA